MACSSSTRDQPPLLARCARASDSPPGNPADARRRRKKRERTFSAALRPRSARGCREAQPARRRAATLKPSKPAPWSDETTHARLARIGSGLAALSLAATLQLSTAAPPAAATELDVLKAKVPNGYIIDDGKVFSRATSAEVTKARRLSACARRV